MDDPGLLSGIESRVIALIVAGHSVKSICESTGASRSNVYRIRAIPHVQATIRDRLQAMADRAYMRSLGEVDTAFDTLKDIAELGDEEAPPSTHMRLQAASTLARLAITSAAALKKDAPPVPEATRNRVIRIELAGAEDDSLEVDNSGDPPDSDLPAAPGDDG